MRCPTCGTENREPSRVCFFCGAILPEELPATPPAPAAPPPPSPPPRVEPRRARDHRREFVGLIGFAFFLIILGIVFYLNQNLVQQFITWGEDVASARTLVRPPEDLLRSAMLFWFLIGGTNFIVALLRWEVTRSKLRTLGAVLGGFGTVGFAYLLWIYSERRITGQLVMSFEAAVIGALLIIYVGFGLYWSSMRRRVPVAEAQRESVRP